MVRFLPYFDADCFLQPRGARRSLDGIGVTPGRVWMRLAYPSRRTWFSHHKVLTTGLSCPNWQAPVI